MSTTKTSGTPSYVKWGAGILLVLAFAFAWYVIASESESEKATTTATEAVTDVSAKTDSVVSNVTDSLSQTKVGQILGEAAQEESVEPYAPAAE